LNFDLLSRTQCYFGGGTAIVLKLNEYRESVDVDFLCASHDGYRELRNTVNQNSLGGLLLHPVPLAREVKADRYGIRTFCLVDGVPIKLEVVREDRIALTGQIEPQFPVPVLSQIDMYAEKLLANTDRWADRSTSNRDLIDLGMMVHHRGAIPEQTWLKAEGAYGDSVKSGGVPTTDASRPPENLPEQLVHGQPLGRAAQSSTQPKQLSIRTKGKPRIDHTPPLRGITSPCSDKG